MVRLNCEAVVDLCGRSRRRWSAAAAAILNVASTAAFQPLQASPHTPRARRWYCPSPKPSTGARALGVTVTVLCPGPVRTEFAAVAGIDADRRRHPRLCLTTPDKVAEAAIRGFEATIGSSFPGDQQHRRRRLGGLRRGSCGLRGTGLSAGAGIGALAGPRRSCVATAGSGRVRSGGAPARERYPA